MGDIVYVGGTLHGTIHEPALPGEVLPVTPDPIITSLITGERYGLMMMKIGIPNPLYPNLPPVQWECPVYAIEGIPGVEALMGGFQDALLRQWFTNNGRLNGGPGPAGNGHAELAQAIVYRAHCDDCPGMGLTFDSDSLVRRAEWMRTHIENHPGHQPEWTDVTAVPVEETISDGSASLGDVQKG